ncbi:hypothetical protein EBQ93_01265, partial [bacterium]|nr:hypothetical protein [bacterium]
MKSFFKFFLTVCILFANSQSIFGAVSLQEFIKKIPEDYEISLTLDQRNNLNGVDLTSEVFYNQNRDNIQSQKSWKVALIRKRRIKYYDNYLTWFAGNASAEASGAAGGGGAITHPKDSRLVRKSSLFDYLEPKSSTADG